MGVPGAEERLLERRRRLPAAHDPQQEPAAVLDRHDGQQEDPRGAPGAGREELGDVHR